MICDKFFLSVISKDFKYLFRSCWSYPIIFIYPVVEIWIDVNMFLPRKRCSFMDESVRLLVGNLGPDWNVSTLGWISIKCCRDIHGINFLMLLILHCVDKAWMVMVNCARWLYPLHSNIGDRQWTRRYSRQLPADNGFSIWRYIQTLLDLLYKRKTRQPWHCGLAGQSACLVNRRSRVQIPAVPSIMKLYCHFPLMSNI